MAGLIRAWLAGESRQLRWLSFEDYARRVFANDHPAWHTDPMRYASGLSDANRVLGSQVVSFDFGAVFASHAQLATGGNGAQRIHRLLNDANVSRFCKDAIAAMVHRLNDRADVVLQLPSPSAALVTLGEDAANIDFDMLDDAANALAELLRGFSSLPVTGLVLAFTDNGVDAGDEIEACEVLQGLAGHYDWLFGLCFDSEVLAGRLAELSPDIRLIGTLEASRLAAQTTPTGGGLGSDFWSGGQLPPAPGACLYGAVPSDLDPRLIVERIACLP
ncbi:MAG: hypothetical protein V2I26_19530 [Halieaceae bacterium]|jgi:hypothetical protein|nr:hypothetical protein [Halieaceae bacterium]